MEMRQSKEGFMRTYLMDDPFLKWKWSKKFHASFEESGPFLSLLSSCIFYPDKKHPESDGSDSDDIAYSDTNKVYHRIYKFYLHKSDKVFRGYAF